MRALWFVILCGLICLSCEKELPQGEHRELVVQACGSCHGMGVLMERHRSRAQWEKVITWMQKMNGMAPLSADNHKAILDYLEKLSVQK